MRLAILPSLCLLGSTIAAPLDLQRRDLAIITYNVKRVNDAMKILDNSLKRKPGRDPASQTSFFSAVIPAQKAVLDGLIEAQGGTSMFSDAVISKQTLLNQAIGQGIKNQISSFLDKAITEYKKR